MKKILKSSLLALLLISVLMIFTACNTSSPKETTEEVVQETTTKEITDRAGNVVEVPISPVRIISTAPSNTEILVGLGVAGEIVAVDNWSPLDGLAEDTAMIDFGAPDAEAILALEPDLLIVHGHNAVGDEDPFKLIKDAGVAVVTVETSTSIKAIYEDINFIGELVGKETEAAAMVDELTESVEAIRAIGETVTDKETVYFEISEWDGTLYTLGNDTFLNEMIDIIGATNVYADQNSWLSVSAEDVVAKNPSVIITNNSYLPDGIESIKSRDGFADIAAVTDDKVYLIDANPSSRPSQYIAIALEQMAKAIYPDLYDFE